MAQITAQRAGIVVSAVRSWKNTAAKTPAPAINSPKPASTSVRVSQEGLSRLAKSVLPDRLRFG